SSALSSRATPPSPAAPAPSRCSTTGSAPPASSASSSPARRSPPSPGRTKEPAPQRARECRTSSAGAAFHAPGRGIVRTRSAMRNVHDLVSATAAATARDRFLIAARRGERMEESPDQLAALLEASAALDSAGIAYALIGGIAVGIHSEVPRATQDVDVAVPSDAARTAVVEALSGAGFEL